MDLMTAALAAVMGRMTIGKAASLANSGASLGRDMDGGRYAECN